MYTTKWKTWGIMPQNVKKVQNIIAEQNLDIVWKLSLSCGILSFIFSAWRKIVEQDLRECIIFGVYAVVFVLLGLLSFYMKKRNSDSTVLSNILSTTVVVLYLLLGIYDGVITNPDGNSGIVLSFIVVTQAIFIMYPIQHCILVIGNYLFFLICAFAFDRSSYTQIVDMTNITLVTIISLILGYYLAKVRVQQFVAQKQLKEWGDEIYYRSIEDYKEITRESLVTIAHTIDVKDSYTSGHSERVAIYAREMAKELGKSKEEQERMYYIGLVHDIGKIAVPKAIINKPGKLTEEEFEIIKRHPTVGGEILKDFHAVEGIVAGARFHHERIDGKGYPQGIIGNEIPEIARIISVADTYDALTSNRSYRNGFDVDKACEILEEVKGTQLDENFVPIMIKIANKMK